MAPRKVPLEERFAKWTRKTETGCWEWLGQFGTGGYAYIKHSGKKRKAATVAYEFYKGLVPKGLEISHLCSNVCCVNPDHLVTETHSENLKRRRPYTLPSRQKGPEHHRAYQKKWRAEHAEYLKAYYREYNKRR